MAFFRLFDETIGCFDDEGGEGRPVGLQYIHYYMFRFRMCFIECALLYITQNFIGMTFLKCR